MLRLREDLVVMPELTGGPPGYTVEDPLRGKFFRMGVPEYTFLAQLDGRRSIAEAVGQAAVKLGPQSLSEREALALCHWAMESQLAQPLGGEGSTRIAAAAARHERQRVWAMTNPLCVRIPLIDPDWLVSRIVPWCGWGFTWSASAVWIGMVGFALYLAGSGWPRIESSAAVILDRNNWLRLAMAWVLLKVLHEAAHGLTCKRFGGTVGSAGDHPPVFHAAGLCRRHVFVAFSFEMAADRDGGCRHLRRAFRGVDRDNRLGDFFNQHRANNGLEHRPDRWCEYARIQRQPVGTIRRLLHPLRLA